MTIEDYFKFAAALIFVLGLMGGLALALRYFGSPRNGIRMGTKKTLEIIETLPLDVRRKLVLIRRGDKQHLVILSPSGDTVIESGINSDHDES